VHKGYNILSSRAFASGFIVVNVLNCGFGWFASEGWGFIVVVFFSSVQILRK
jgi:hypothetical protein